MQNFIEETLEIIGDKGIKECKLGFMSSGDDDTQVHAKGESKEALMSFLNSLPERAREYDNSYGCQEWEGWVSFQDGTWIERSEYDGSEWWSYRSCPKLS